MIDRQVITRFIHAHTYRIEFHAQDDTWYLAIDSKDATEYRRIGSDDDFIDMIEFTQQHHRQEHNR